MAPNRKMSSWSFFLVWVVLSFLDVLLGFLIFFIGASLLGESSGALARMGIPLTLLLFVIAFGLVTGVAQWSVLKRYKEGTAAWIGATLLGFLISSPAVLFWGGGFGPVILPTASLIMTAVSGLALGLMQWLFLRRKAGLSPWWIGVSFLGWILADVIAIWLRTLSYQMGPIYYWVGLIFFGIMLTGVGITLLFRQRTQSDLPGT
ncbi:MAG: hypothetical protein WBV22_07220 [Anaerolineaceae bacterium]